MTMKKKTWHYRWYQYWLTNGQGNSPTYREDLCHYIRVILWWAPITWIDQHTIINWDMVGKFILIGAIAIYAVAIIAMLSYKFPTQMVLAGLSLGALIVSTVIIIGFFRWRQGKNFGIASTTSLAWKYAVAKKHKICPYLEFE